MLLSEMTSSTCRRVLADLILHEVRNSYFSHVDMAGELEKCSAFVGAETRTDPKSTLLWLVSATKELP